VGKPGLKKRVNSPSSLGGAVLATAGTLMGDGGKFIAGGTLLDGRLDAGPGSGADWAIPLEN
jgi:hypothetical protein